MVPEEPEASAWSKRRQGLSKFRSQGRQGGSIPAGGLHSHLQESWGRPEVGHPGKGAGRMNTPGTRPLGLFSKPRGPPAPAAVLGVPLRACSGVCGYCITRGVQKHHSRDRELLRAPQTPSPRCSLLTTSTLPPLPSPEGKPPSAVAGVPPPPRGPSVGNTRVLTPLCGVPSRIPPRSLPCPGEKLPIPGNPRRPQPHRGEEREEVEDGAPGVAPLPGVGARCHRFPPAPNPTRGPETRARRFRPRPSGKSAPSMQMNPHAKFMQIKPSSQTQRSLRSSPPGVGCNPRDGEPRGSGRPRDSGKSLEIPVRPMASHPLCWEPSPGAGRHPAEKGWTLGGP